MRRLLIAPVLVAFGFAASMAHGWEEGQRLQLFAGCQGMDNLLTFKEAVEADGNEGYVRVMTDPDVRCISRQYHPFVLYVTVVGITDVEIEHPDLGTFEVFELVDANGDTAYTWRPKVEEPEPEPEEKPGVEL